MVGPPHWHENWNLSKWKSKSSKLKSKKNQQKIWKFSKSITIRYTSVKWTLRFVKIKIIKIEIKKKIIFFENFDFFSKCQECLRSEGRKIFQFFFWFSCSEWLNSQKKAKFFFENFDFFSKSKECGGFWPFWPLEREPKFFLIWGFR